MLKGRLREDLIELLGSSVKDAALFVKTCEGLGILDEKVCEAVVVRWFVEKMTKDGHLRMDVIPMTATRYGLSFEAVRKVVYGY